ncbi:MAG: porin [Polaromonas sp.]|uniref:porin n=1 Tax=Polaromonas sp. TaxID=1869339 RepID=UPI003264BE87
MMKKSLVALAVLAVSGVASAQSNVTLYGLVDAWVGTVKDNNLSQSGVNVAHPFSGSGGGLQTSRFGLKGSEDLGGGLKANFLLEAGFDPSTGVANNYSNPYGAPGNSSNAIFGRQSWVGLSGGFGELKLGKMWTPYDMVKGSGAAGFDSLLFAPSTSVWASNSYQDRPGNSVYYQTPDFGGFSAAAMYSFGENKTATVSAGKIASMNVAYANGPIGASLAYQTEKTTGASTAIKYTQLNGSYDFGVVKLLGAYGEVKNGATPITGVAADKTKEYQIGLDFPVSSTFTLSGGYARSKSTRLGGLPELKRTGYGLAGLYAVSKRTNLYAGVQSGKETGSGVADRKTSTYGVGVRHTF